ncbi:aldolase/citrate lyase family protein [Streptomyces sp. NPDC005181]|uniref:HpcH/HpaI aldolase/citrate lyase family protein n=1 Tax=Streptomyces sp. NPDC005181 TaxID=3156869 RepID=UPI0033AF4368
MTVLHDRITAARSLLFVPGDRPDRFGKAASCGPDLVIIDLEDAVAVTGKDRARDNAADWLALGNQAIVRINPPGTPWSEADLGAAAEHGCPVMVPKAEDPAVLADLAARTAGRCGLIPLIETALGVERALEVCATPSVARAAFGNVDLAARLGVAHDDHAALSYARSRLVARLGRGGRLPAGRRHHHRPTGHAHTACRHHSRPPPRLHRQALHPPDPTPGSRRRIRAFGAGAAVGTGRPRSRRLGHHGRRAHGRQTGTGPRTANSGTGPRTADRGLTAPDGPRTAPMS